MFVLISCRLMLLAGAICLALIVTITRADESLITSPSSAPSPSDVAQEKITPDPELSNRRSGISLFWSDVKGVDYLEEYYFHDKSINDRKVVFLRDTTPIIMQTNEWNVLSVGPKGPGQPIGKDGIEVDDDNDPATPPTRQAGVIRYLVDRDGSDALAWGPSGKQPLIPAYTHPIRFADLNFEPGVPVVGTTGPSGVGAKSYHRGHLDEIGNEWHTIAVGHDDATVMPKQREEQRASDGKVFLFVVNPKTPALVVRATGDAQFYTTPPKQYGIAKIVPQTTYFQPGSGSITITVSALGGGEVAYRINAGPWKTGRDLKIADSDFQDGQSTLECRLGAADAPVRIRTVVKNPPHPSRGEPHGNFLWVEEAELQKITKRLQRAPYARVWQDLLSSDEQTLHKVWDANGLAEWRRPWFKADQGSYFGWHPRFGGAALANAFVATINGWDYTRPGEQKSFGRYAKEMVLRNLYGRIDPIRFYGLQSSGPNPSTEVVGAGYYMITIVFDTLPAYDLLAGRFRSDQVPDGLTPIEDYYVRDTMALAASQAAKLMSGGGDAPGLWSTARAAGGLMVAAAMPEYSSPCFGTSGFGRTKSPDGQLTWKTWLTTTKHISPTYPGTTIPVFDPEEPALWREGGIWGGPNLGYFNLMTESFSIILNINARYSPQTKYPVIEQGMANAIAGTLTTIRNAPGVYAPQPRLGNKYLGKLGADSVKAIKAKGNEVEIMRWLGVYGLAWYEDSLADKP